MKKIMYFFMALLVSGVINANENIDQKVVERVKAIVAYEMNIVSLGTDTDENIYSKFKDKAKDCQDINCVMNCLPANYSISRNLCEAIKKKKSTFDDANAIIAYYSDTIFQEKEGAIANFKKKREKEPEIINELQQKIEKRITELLKEIEDSNEVQPNTQKEETNTASVQETKPDVKPENSSDESYSFLDTIKMGIGYLFSIIFAVIIIILFKNNKKIEEECYRLKKDSLLMDEHLQQKNCMVKDLRNKIELLEKDKSILEEDVKNLEEARKKQIRRDQESKVEIVNQDKKKQKIEIHEYYLGVPQNGKFAEGSDVYRRGKALYKLTTIDDIHGEFEYINLPEAVGFAKQSITSFLESACNIMGECSSDFSQIETRVRGKVERTSDGWKIIKKADVYLL